MLDYVFNKRMPYMPFNWSEHQARTSKLSREERAVYEEIRMTLWSVEGVKMDRETLIVRAQLSEEDHPRVDRFIALGLLRSEDGMIFDDVQLHEFNRAIEKSQQARENGKKGGRPPQRAVDPEEF